MEKTIFAVLSLSLLLLAGGGGADACEDYDVPMMSAAVAFERASTGRAMSEMCADEVGTATAPDQEVTDFVFAAVSAAARSCGATARRPRHGAGPVDAAGREGGRPGLRRQVRRGHGAARRRGRAPERLPAGGAQRGCPGGHRRRRRPHHRAPARRRVLAVVQQGDR